MAQEGKVMRRVAVWVVEGEEGCDGSGGLVTMLIMTRSISDLPDVSEAFHRQRGRDDCGLYEIRSARLLGCCEVDGGLLLIDTSAAGD